MDEEMRRIIENYCNTHNTQDSRRLAMLLAMTDDVIYEAMVMAEASDEEREFLEAMIEKEDDSELREALEELDEFLFYDTGSFTIPIC